MNDSIKVEERWKAEEDLKISRSGKKKMSIKEVIENMDLDGIE